jgi:hypothetical protein
MSNNNSYYDTVEEGFDFIISPYKNLCFKKNYDKRDRLPSGGIYINTHL